MRASRLIVAGLVDAASVGFTAGVAEAATLTVGVSAGCETIQACVDTASDGDTVNVPVGEYRENVVVDKAVTITGQGPRFRRCSTERVIVDAQPGGVAGIGFDVQADDVTIRCLTVRNGLTGVRVGFDVAPGDGFTLERARVIDAREASVAIVGDGFRVLNSTVLGGGEDADGSLEVEGAGGLVQGARVEQSNTDCFSFDVEDTRILRNTAAICDSVGFEVEGSGNVVDGNRTDNTRNEGFEVDGDDNLVQGNQMANGSSSGFFVDGDANLVLGNRASNMGNDGFSITCVDGCTGGRVEGNVATGNTGDDAGFDIFVEEGVIGFQVLNNRAEGNQEEGFLIEADGAMIRGNTSTGNGGSDGDEGTGFELFGDDNVVEDNVARQNRDDGFRLFGDTNTLRGNLSERNLRDGFHVEVEDPSDPADQSEGNLLDDNRAVGNQAEGIENDGLDTELTDNVARNNRTDCAGDGTVAVDIGNVCDDGSNFGTPGEVDRAPAP